MKRKNRSCLSWEAKPYSRACFQLKNLFDTSTKNRIWLVLSFPWQAVNVFRSTCSLVGLNLVIALMTNKAYYKTVCNVRHSSRIFNAPVSVSACLNWFLSNLFMSELRHRFRFLVLYYYLQFLLCSNTTFLSCVQWHGSAHSKSPESVRVTQATWKMATIILTIVHLVMYVSFMIAQFLSFYMQFER